MSIFATKKKSLFSLWIWEIFFKNLFFKPPLGERFYKCFLRPWKTIIVQATSTRYCKNRANCDKNMKFGSDVPYTKIIKKSKGDKAQLCIASRGQKKPSWGLPIGWKIKVPKYSHTIYQSIANYMYVKNIKTFLG